MQTHNFFDNALLKKYNTSGPRYTSYPTALEFTEQFKYSDLVSTIEALSLIHI